MEQEWAAHALQREHVVLGLRLRPYSCGHEILLCRIGSPFAVEAEADWFDLFVAVLVCSQTFKDGQTLVQSPRKSRLFILAWRLWLKVARVDLYAELAKFYDYLSDGRWSPPAYDIKAKPGWESRTLKAPRVYRLIPMLCEKLGLRETDALDFPVARANLYAAAIADRDGTIDLEGGSSDEALKKHLADLEARAAKGEAVWDF